MRTLIYSDVHGNLPAFELMLKSEGPCDRYICLGDLVNYGPWSNECVDLALSLPNSELIMGNHEAAFIQGSYPGKNPLVQAFFKQCFQGFVKTNHLLAFKPSILFNEFLCIHTIDELNIYPDTTMVLDANYIIGHSHHQFRYVHGEFTLYNAGSVGQNRKYINEINYLIYHDDEHRFELKSLVYNLDPLISEMKRLNYPQECIQYYRDKELK